MAGTAAGAAKARQARGVRVQTAESVTSPYAEENKVFQEATTALLKDEAQKRLEAKFGSRRPKTTPDSYRVARRPLKWHGYVLPVGTTIPDAPDWARVETWVRSGLIEPVYGQEMTDPAPEKTDNSPRPEDGGEELPQDDADYSGDLEEESA